MLLARLGRTPSSPPTTRWPMRASVRADPPNAHVRNHRGRMLIVFHGTSLLPRLRFWHLQHGRRGCMHSYVTYPSRARRMMNVPHAWWQPTSRFPLISVPCWNLQWHQQFGDWLHGSVCPPALRARVSGSLSNRCALSQPSFGPQHDGSLPDRHLRPEPWPGDVGCVHHLPGWHQHS